MIFFNWPHKYLHPNILQERLANVDKAIESIVRSLGRRVTERKLAAALLLELSKYDRLREYIGKVQGCIGEGRDGCAGVMCRCFRTGFPR